jgi:hypothetical protein
MILAANHRLAGRDRSFPWLIAGYALKTIIATRLALTLLF